MSRFYPNGFVVYSEIAYDASGLSLDKNCERGFAWILKDPFLDTKSLFPKKNSLRVLTDTGILKKYISQCINYEIPYRVNFIFTAENQNSVPADLTEKIINTGKFLGFDCLSPDMDYSPVYEAYLSDIYSDQNLCDFLKEKLTDDICFAKEEDLDYFIAERNRIINSFANTIALDLNELNLVLKPNQTKKGPEFYRAQVWDVPNINEII